MRYKDGTSRRLRAFLFEGSAGIFLADARWAHYFRRWLRRGLPEKAFLNSKFDTKKMYGAELLSPSVWSTDDIKMLEGPLTEEYDYFERKPAVTW